MPKYRLEATCSKELWADQQALRQWGLQTARRRCVGLDMQLSSDSAVLIVHETRIPDPEIADSDCRIAIIFRCVSKTEENAFNDAQLLPEVKILGDELP